MKMLMGMLLATSIPMGLSPYGPISTRTGTRCSPQPAAAWGCGARAGPADSNTVFTAPKKETRASTLKKKKTN